MVPSHVGTGEIGSPAPWPRGTCILNDDQVYCWPWPAGGDVGDLLALDLGIATVQVAPSDHSCVRGDAGEIRCWGASSYGVLGYGNDVYIGDDEAPGAGGDVPLGDAAVDLCTGATHTCAALASGGVRCWGEGTYGALGYGDPSHIGDDETPDTLEPLDFRDPVVDVECGYRTTCARFASGDVRCWGSNEAGELGQSHMQTIGDDEPATVLEPIELGGPAIALTTGDFHACAVLEDRSVRCWGANGEGQLGLGHAANIGDDETPEGAGAVDLGGRVAEIDAGGSSTCAVIEGLHVKCWGRGEYGHNGYGDTEQLGDDPTEVPAMLPDVVFP